MQNVGGDLERVLADDRLTLRALRAGDERVFRELVARYQPSLVRVAQIYVGARAVAEEVAQETWLGVLKGLDRFEERSSLRTWIFRILTNIAKTRAQREGRTIPLSALEDPGRVPEPAVEPDRFLDAEHARWPGHWAAKPSSWAGLPEERLLEVVGDELDELLAAQLFEWAIDHDRYSSRARRTFERARWRSTR